MRILRSPRPAVLAEFPGIQELYRWFRELGSREPVRVMFANPRVLTLETGVPAMAVVTNPDVGVVLSEIERHGITHVVIGDPAPRVDRSRSMERLLETAAGRLVLEYENSSFAVYRVRSGDPP